LINDVAAFGKRVRFLRKLEGWTQAQLAEGAGISLEHLNKLERGAAAPSFKVICQLARALHTEPANLLLFPEAGGAPGEREDDCLKHVSGLGSWHIDHLTGEIFTSAGLCGLLGLPARPVVGPDCMVKPRVIPADMPLYDKAHEQLAKAENVGPSAIRLRRADGEARHVVAVAEPLRDQAGNITGTCGSMVDVTEPLRLVKALRGTQEILEQRVRERTEQLGRTIEQLNTVIAEQESTSRSLRETEYRLRLILNSLPIMVAYVDRDERLLFVNERYARYRGGTPTDYVGRSVRDVVGDNAYVEVSQGNVRKALSGERVISEIQVDMPDGSRPYLYAQWIPTWNDQGEVDALFYWALDISERKFAEEILCRSEERFRVLVENLPDIYWVIDEHGLSYLSPSFENYFDLPVEVAKEDTLAILDRLHPDDRAKPDQILRRLWDEGTVFEYSVRVKQDGGGYKHLSVHNYPVRDSQKRIVQVVGVARPLPG